MQALRNTLNGYCGGLNENDSQRLMCLNIWPPVGGTFREGLGGLVEGGVSLRADFDSHFPSALCLLLVDQDMSSQHVFAPSTYTLILLNHNPMKFLLYVALVIVLYPTIEK